MGLLEKFYEERRIDESIRIPLEKNIILIVEDEEYDFSWFLDETGFDRCEFSVTWPKPDIELVEEVTAASPELVIQLGKKFSRRYPFVEEGKVPSEIKERMDKAVADNFVVLHHHDEYSLKDGLGTVDQLTKVLKRQRRSFCCVTNHGSVGGWIKQNRECKKAGIKPIFGMEAYVSNYRGDDPELKRKHRSANHLILLAKNETGFYNIIRIHNDAQLEGFYYSPRMDHEAAKKWGEGIIGTSACFLPGTMVFTPYGFKKIEDVQNECVVTHKGDLLKANPTKRRYSGLVRNIKCRGLCSEIFSTNNHKMLVVKKEDQRKCISRLLSGSGWEGVDKQVRTARRREFISQWTDDISQGDWLLFPVERDFYSVASIDTSCYNNGLELGHRVQISNEGLVVVKKARKECGKTIKEIGSWTKANLYRVEKGNSQPQKLRLIEHLESIGIDSDEFIRKYCSYVTSDSCGLLKNKLPEKLDIDSNLMFVLGAYCAEGSCGKWGVSFTLHSNEDDFASEIMDSLFEIGIKSTWKKRMGAGKRGDVTAGSTPLANFLRDVCGEGSENKKVPDFIFSLSWDMKKHFLRGYLMGDGCLKTSGERSNGRVVSVSVSEALSLGVSRIMLSGGYYPTISNKGSYVKNGVRHKRTYWVSVAGRQHRPLADFVWGNGDGCLYENDMDRKNVPIRSNGVDYYTSVVVDVSRYEVDDIEVRCLSVEDDKSFVVNFASVHNCMAGEIPQALMNDDYDEAKRVYEHYRDSFDEFYIELQIIEFEMQREVNRKLIEFARDMGAPVILACDSHYLDPAHAETHDLLMYIRQGKTKLDVVEKDEDVWDFEVRNLYYRTDRQMKEVFEKGFVDNNQEERPEFLDEVFTEEVFNEAMQNTLKVARKIENIELDSTIKLPKLYKDSMDILREKVNKGFKELKLNKHPEKKKYVERLRYEFDVITKLGWADYFLIMEKIITMAKEEFYEEVGEWAIGYGRGSASGCLISWCLGLTDCDPIEHGLLFERFLDEGRPDPPDIDTDFHPAIRQKVKDKIVDMFGVEKTCSIGTYQTYKTKAVIIDVARALGYDVVEANQVTKEMDSLKSFESDDGEEEIVDKMEFDELCNHYPQLDEYFEKYPDVKIHASVIRNQVKNMGKHAGGVIISDMNLAGQIPVQSDKDGSIISSWAESGNTAELSEVGLVKYDILGLNNLPIIADCVRLVKENKGIEIKRSEIPLDDKKAIRMESKNDLFGIFQLENPGTKPIVDQVGMESLADVSAITSLLRPGPKDMGMHLEYAERKAGAPYDVIPCLDWIFKDTYGILVYQEQMMQISQELCGFDGPMANKLRKACGKKIKELMDSIKEKFIEGAQPKIDSGEVTLEQVEQLWELIVSFARYGFNKAHAVTYSMITTAELWLKHHYFLEYMTALALNTPRGKKKHGSADILVDYLNYARKRGVEVLAPDINAPDERFHIHEKYSIRYGLEHVKNVASAANNISEIASKEPFKDMADFYERCTYETEIKSGPNAGKMRVTRPNTKVVESLIYAGAFDSFGDRAQMFTEYNIAKLGIPNPTDEEIEENKKKVLKKGFTESPGVNEKDADFSCVKSVGEVNHYISQLAMEKPFEGMADFYERCVYEKEIKSGKNAGDMRTTRPTKKVMENLIYAGAFREFGDVRKLLKEYYIVKNKVKPFETSEDDLIDREIEMIGMCLSKEPLCYEYKEVIEKNKWCSIGDNHRYEKPMVFGRIDNIESRNSRAGNPMFVVQMSDGLDSISFFVFKGAMDYFRDNVKKGYLVAIPMKRFDDGGALFFNDRGEIERLEN